MAKKISIIIPVYNSEKYLRMCMDSVVGQGDYDFEVIAVNDGSTDKSPEILAEYAGRDSRIKIINKENGGFSSARNAGLEAASGDYILFVDSDDEISPDSLKVLTACIEEHDVDVIRFNRLRTQEFNDGSSKDDTYGARGICDDGKAHLIPSREDFYKNYVRIYRSGAFSGIWNALYKRSLFENIRFNTEIKSSFEDFIINFEIYKICQSILFIPNTLYHYYRRENQSVSTSYNPNRVNELVATAESELELIKKNEKFDGSLMLPGDVLYLGVLVKTLMNPHCSMTRAEKIKTIKSLKDKEPFKLIYTESFRELRKSEKVYLTLFKMNMFGLLYDLSGIVLKMRGNI